MLFATTTLPQVLLLLVFYSQYTLLRSQLDETEIHMWHLFATILGVLVVSTLATGVRCIKRQKPLPATYAIFTLLAYSAYLVTYYLFESEIFPRSIPNWVLSEDSHFYTVTLLMPALAHGVFILVAHLTRPEDDPSIVASIMGGIFVPGGLVVLGLFMLVFTDLIGSDVTSVLVACFFVVATIALLYFLVRALYILALRTHTTLENHRLIWKIPVTILLPLAGLALNNGLIIDGPIFHEIFGDFRHPLFYILATVNGILLCLPAAKNNTYRLVLFCARFAMLAYTAYFFIVFLPYLPLSIISIMIFGLGLLMFAPLALSIVHITELYEDYVYLRQYFSRVLLIIIAVAGFAVLPGAITVNNLHTRAVLHQSLDYLYNTDYNNNYQPDTAALASVLKVIHDEDAGARNDFMNRKLPYLSTYFKWMVLDNLSLQADKANMLKAVFLDDAYVNPASSMVAGNPDVAITDIKSTSHYDTAKQAWISQVDLKITNHDSRLIQAEYSTTINLPAGCWISDYYLYVTDTGKQHGILAEKATAMWVYNQIRTIERRDPGLLYYLTGNKVAFHVFPFATNETRKTGIEFIHREPVTVTIDGYTFALGDTTQQAAPPVEKTNDGHTIYIPAAQKQKLPKVHRKPYYHFVVDVSAGQGSMKEEYIHRIESKLSQQTAGMANAKVSFVNYGVHTYSINDGLKENYNQQQFVGGFYLDRAIRAILYNELQQPTNQYPVIVVVSDKFEDAIIEKDFSDFTAAYPESDLYYRILNNGQLETHYLNYNPKEATGIVDIPTTTTQVLAYPDTVKPIAYLPDNNLADIIIHGTPAGADVKKLSEKNWANALEMYGDMQAQVLQPSIAEKRWHNSVAASFATRVMLPVTSYIVVENEMQKEALKRKQEQILNAKKALSNTNNLENNNNASTGAPVDGGVLALVAALALYTYYTQRREKLV